MDSEVLVPLLVTPVLGDAVDVKQTIRAVSFLAPLNHQHLGTLENAQVKVVPSDDDGVGHLGGPDDTREDSASDRNVTGEGTLLVDVGSVDGLSGGLETKTNILVPSLGLGVDLLSTLIAARHRWSAK